MSYKRITRRDGEHIFYTCADGNANPGQIISKHGLVFPAFERLAQFEDAIEVLEREDHNVLRLFTDPEFLAKMERVAE